MDEYLDNYFDPLNKFLTSERIAFDCNNSLLTDEVEHKIEKIMPTMTATSIFLRGYSPGKNRLLPAVLDYKPIKNLELYNSSFDMDCWSIIANIMQRITEIHIIKCKWDIMEWKTFLNHLVTNETITNLSIYEELNDDICQVLTDSIISNKRITYINLIDCEIPSDYIYRILAENKKLEMCKISKINNFKNVLTAISRNNSLKTISLSEVEFNQIEIDDTLPENTTLECMMLNGIFHSDSIESIASYLNKCKALEDLSIYNNVLVNDNGSFIVDALQKNTTITKLRLDNFNFVGAAGLNLVKMLVENTTINSLNIGDCNLDDETVAAIGESLIKNKTLAKFTISPKTYCSMEPILKAIAHNTGLKFIDLDCCDLCNMGESLAESLTKNNTLTKLSIANAEMSEDDIASILTSLAKNNTLRSLIVGDSIHELMKAGIRRLIKVFLETNNTTLTKLTFYTSGIYGSKKFEDLLINHKSYMRNLTSLQGLCWSTDVNNSPTFPELLKHTIKDQFKRSNFECNIWHV